MILEFDEYWISKVDQKLFEYDSGKYIATFGFVEGDHDAVYIRIYELRVWNSVSDWIFQGGHWIEKDWTKYLWMDIPIDMIEQIELLAERYFKLKWFI